MAESTAAGRYGTGAVSESLHVEMTTITRQRGEKGREREGEREKGG